KAADRAALSKALADASAAGWRIVYLATGGDRPLQYRNVREWALQQMRLDEAALPDGAVLGRIRYYAGLDEAAARQEVLGALARDFKGPLLYVASMPVLKLQSVGPGGALDSPGRPLVDWSELVNALPK